MKFKKNILIIFCVNILLFKGLSGEEVFHYTVNFLFIPSLNLKMKISNKDSSCKKLEFHASTNNFFDRIYKVDNYYQCVYDKSSFLPEYRSKIIDQPKLEQQVKAMYARDRIYYSNDKTVELQEKTFSFLSMLMYLRDLCREGEISQNINLEVEGKIYSAQIIKTGTENIQFEGEQILTDIIEINLELVEGHNSVLKDSDLFFENVVHPQGTRKVWIEQNSPNRIIKAKFAIKNTWLVAILKGG
jgi:hypothetical protein